MLGIHSMMKGVGSFWVGEVFPGGEKRVRRGAWDLSLWSHEEAGWVLGCCSCRGASRLFFFLRGGMCDLLWVFNFRQGWLLGWFLLGTGAGEKPHLVPE